MMKKNHENFDRYNQHDEHNKKLFKYSSISIMLWMYSVPKNTPILWK